MKNNKKYLPAIFFIILLIVGMLCSFMFKRQTFKLIYADDPIIYASLKALTEQLNSEAKAHNFSKKIDIYGGNFVNSDIPEIKNPQHTNVLWIGSRRAFDLEKLKKYDYIFVSTTDLELFLRHNNFNVTLLPIFVPNNTDLPRNNCLVNPKQKQCHWAVIGYAPDFVAYLREHNIPFKNYYFLDSELGNDFHNLLGIASADEHYGQDSLDISPLYFIAALKKIPLVVYKPVQEFNFSTTYFNDTIQVYSTPEDIPFLFTDKHDMTNAQALVKYFFTEKDAAQRVLSALENKPYINKPLDDLLTIWTVSKPMEYSNGDFAFAHELAKHFKSYFKYQQVTFPASFVQKMGEVNIYLRGVIRFFAEDIFPGRLSLLYIIYPSVDNFKDKDFKVTMDQYIETMKEEVQLFDGVIVASQRVQKALQQNGIPAYFVAQFTNPQLFYPDPKKDLETDVLFVGTYYFNRPSVPILLKHGIAVDIYGPAWGDIAKGEYIDNRILRQYYSSAKIVLNDTRPDMQQLGFISNRIYDASACGALVISDYIPEIEEIYGDSVPMWKTADELVSLVKYYTDPAHEAERMEKAKRAQEITLNNFTTEATARNLQQIIEKIKKEKAR